MRTTRIRGGARPFYYEPFSALLNRVVSRSGFAWLASAMVFVLAQSAVAQPFPPAGDDSFPSKLTFKVTLSPALGGQTFNITMQGPTCVARSAAHPQAADPSGPMGAGGCPGGAAGAIGDGGIGVPFPLGFNSGGGIDEVHTRMMDLVLNGGGWTLRAGASAPLALPSYGEVESRGGAAGFGGPGADSFFKINFEIDVPATVAPPTGLTLFNAESLTVEVKGLKSFPPTGSTYIHTHSITGRVMLFDRASGCFVGWIEEGGHGVGTTVPPYTQNVTRKKPLVFSVDCFAEGLLMPGPCGVLGHAPPNDVFALGMVTGQGAWGYSTEGEIFQSSGAVLGLGPDMTNVDRFAAALGIGPAPGAPPFHGPFSPNPGAPNPAPAPPGAVTGSLGLIPRDNLDSLSFGRDRGDTLLFSIDPASVGVGGSAANFNALISAQGAAIGGVGVVPSNGGGDPGNEAAGDIYISPKLGQFPPPGWPVIPPIPPTPLLAPAAPAGLNLMYHDELDMGLQAPAVRHSALCQTGAFVGMPGGGGGGGGHEPMSLGPPSVAKGIGLDIAERQEVVAASGIQDEDAEILHTSTLELPTLQDELMLAKVMDRQSGDVVGVALNKAGLAVDMRQAQLDESQEYDAVYGRLHHKLFDQLNAAKDDDQIPIAIWLDAPDTSAANVAARGFGLQMEAGKPIGEFTDNDRSQLLSQKSAIYVANNTPLSNAVLGLGAQVEYVGQLTPLICARGTPAQIRQIATLAGVDRVYGTVGWTDKLGNANPAVQNTAMKAAGHLGNGISVGIIEYGTIDFANVYLDHTGASPGSIFRRRYFLSVRNASGANAGRLRITFNNTNNNTFVHPNGVDVYRLGAPNPQALCGTTTVTSNGVATNTVEIRWPNNCVLTNPAPQYYVAEFVLQTTSAAAVTFNSGQWQTAAGVNVGPALVAGDVTITPLTGNSSHTTGVAGCVASSRAAGTEPAYPPGAGDGMAPAVTLLSGNIVGGLSGIADGGNGVCNTAANPATDDQQFVPNGAACGVGQIVVGPGTNGRLETNPGPDDVRREFITDDLAGFAAASEWAVTNNAKILNMSIGEVVSDLTFDASDRFVDHLIFEHFVATCVAASNECGAANVIERNGAGIANTAAAGDDIQVTPVGNATVANQIIVSPGPNGILDTTPVAGAGTPATGDTTHPFFGRYKCDITSPGLAYNCITVGAIDDLNTAALPDDIRASYSCYVDLAGDYEKPELSAPGTNITMPDQTATPAPVNTARTWTASGTSFATPIVAGYLANMLSKDPTLSAWPETTKAIALASTKRNVYGNAIESLGASGPGSASWDGMEGSGTIWVDKGLEIMNANHYDKKVVNAADFPRNRIVSKTVSAVQGEQFRYAIAWSTHTSGGNHENIPNDTLTADLDLYVYDCCGNLVAWSASFNNAYEVVSFYSPKTQNYRVEIRAFRFDAAFEYLGEAWNADNPICDEDDLDALEVSDGSVVDPDVDGIPNGGNQYVYFSLKTSSPTIGRPDPYPGSSTGFDPNGVTPDDLLVSPAPAGGPLTFAIYARGIIDIGLLPGDDVDGLVLLDNNLDGILQPNLDIALFTLSRGSPSLVAFGASSADVFLTTFNGTFALYAPAGALGLIAPIDNVDALDIGGELPPPCCHATPSTPGLTFVDFGTGGANPAIPGNFFGPGSDPFTGRIDLMGSSINPDLYGNASMLSQTSGHATLADDPIGTSRTVDLEITQLNLVSINPITVTSNGGQNPQQWNVTVGLSPSVVPLGSLTATKTHPNGGVFDTTLPVQPFLIFTNANNPDQVVTLDTGEAGLPPHMFQSQGAPYVHTVNPALNVVAPADGSFVPGVHETTPGNPQSQITVQWQENDPTTPSRHTVRPPVYAPPAVCLTCVADLTGDYVRDGSDVHVFTTCVLTGGGPACACADVNGDSQVTFDDISGFVSILLNNTGPCVGTGACCLGNGSCLDGVTATDCANQGGEYQGANSSCSGVSCPTFVCIPPGDDCWVTSCAGGTTYSFVNSPLPADFFGPGSLPFEGVVILGGSPSGPFGTDTTIHRMSALCFEQPPPSSDTVPIELTSLSLVSCSPITVQYGGGATEQWNIAVSLSTTPAPPGSLTATMLSPSGGTFSSTIFVQPLFEFTRVGPPATQLLDTGAAGIPPMQIDSASAPWTLNPVPGPSCDPVFHPGYDDSPTPCCPEVCHSSFGAAPHDHCVRAPNCPCGACCLSDGSCVENLTATECTDQGGSFQGGGTSCLGSNCTPGNVGACCNTDGTCTDSMTAAACASSGGTYQGDGTLCSGVTCPTYSCIPAGQDCWTTLCGGTNYDFVTTPIPAGFFGPGSDPFTGLVILGGVPTGPFGTDTVIQRLDQLCFLQPPPSSDSVPIQLVALSLQSCKPFVVTYGGVPTEQWIVAVDLSVVPAPPGSLTATQLTPTGGTFDSTIVVQPRFTFTRVSPPGGPAPVYDSGLQGDAPMSIGSTGAPWTTLPVPGPSCDPVFHPGYDDSPTPCCPEVCHSSFGSAPHDHCVRSPECPCGACCLPGGGCAENVTSSDCLAQGGIFQGGATTCAGSNCSPGNTGACCNTNGTCTDGVSSVDCSATGGTYQGDGTLCSGVTCPPVTCIPGGQDCWDTTCGSSEYSFADNPIPAGFFDPGSQPFSGLILVGGGPASPDTVIMRLGDLCFPEPLPSSDSVPIQIVQLNLVSCAPINVVGSGQWNVSVDLSPFNSPVGSMSVTKTHANGGTFDSNLPVQPRFTFSRVSNPSDTRVFDTGQQGIPPTALLSTGAPWVHVSPNGLPCSGGNFVPGTDGQPCCPETCHSSFGTAPHEHCSRPQECPACGGACCLPGGVCVDGVTGPDCGAQGGVYHGDGSTCSGVVCVPGGGACCLPNGTCIDVTVSGDCAAQGGNYQGDGTNCGTVTCPPVTCIPSGQDCWETACGSSNYSFQDNPIPAGFFGPGSDPFTGTISLGGGGGSPDTVLMRLGDLCFSEPLPSTSSVPIQLVQLNLTSCAPITVANSGGSNQWNVTVDLSPNPVPPGNMTVTKTHPNGGTFDSVFAVQPRFHFSRVELPTDTRLFDTGAQGIPATTLNSTGIPWVHVSPIGVPCGGGNFVPGNDGQPCCPESCHSSFGSAPHEHCTRPPECPSCGPPDDSCFTPNFIGDGVTPFTTIGATTDGPSHSVAECQFDRPVHNNVWYQYVASCTGTLTVSTCEDLGGGANFDTRIAIYGTTDCSQLATNLVGCNDDDTVNPCGDSPLFHSTATASVFAGNTYLISVGAWSPTGSGSGSLLVSCNPGPTFGACCFGSSCSDGWDGISCVNNGGVYQGNGSTCGTVVCTPPFGACCFGSSCSEGWDSVSCVNNGGIYQGDGTTCGTIVCTPPFGACCFGVSCADGWDSISCSMSGGFYVGDGSNCMSNPCGGGGTGACCFGLSCSDGYQSSACFNEGGSYLGDGSICLPGSCGTPPPNDACVNAAPIFDGSNGVSTLGATTDGFGESVCLYFGDSQVNQDVWYQYTSCGSFVSLDFCGADYDSKIAVYEGWGCPTIAPPIACIDDSCSGTRTVISFSAIPGGQYLIRVGGYGGNAGTGTLFVTCSP